MTGLRRPDGKLNLSELDKVSRKYFLDHKRLRKILAKNEPKYLAKLNAKRKKEIDNETTDLKKKMRQKIVDKEKKEIIKNAKRAEIDLKNNKKEISNLLLRGIGASFAKSGNIEWRDLLTNDGRKKMLKDLTAFTDANITKEQLKKRIKENEKREEVFKKGLQRLRFRKYPPYLVEDNTIAGGQKVDYLFSYDDVEGDFNFYDTLEANIKRVINNTKWRHPNAKFNIRISTREGEAVLQKRGVGNRKSFVDRYAFSLPRFDKWTIDDVLDILDAKFEASFEKYEEDDEYFDFKTIMISYVIPPTTIMGSGGHKTIQQAHKVWFISDSASKTNCFYRSISYIRLLKDLENEDIERVKTILLDKDPTMLNGLINDRAKNMKKRLETKHRKTTTEDDIQNWVDKCSSHPRTYCEVKVYNNVFGLEKTIVPKKKPVVKGQPKCYEVWCINHHFVPLVRWYDLQKIKWICKEKLDMDLERAEEEANTEDNKIIDKKIAREIVSDIHFLDWCKTAKGIHLDLESTDKTMKKEIVKYQNIYKFLFCKDKAIVRNQIIPFNNRIAAYDIEATPNGNGGNFKSYRISLAFNNIKSNPLHFKTERDGIGVRSFSGKDCIKKFFDFLFTHRAYFSAFTFYAHNGGKFDLLLILNEYILTNKDKWEIDDESLIVLNGAYLNLVLNSVGDLQLGKGMKTDAPSIKFRDSYRLLPMGLDKLCKEFNVPHKKIGEDLEVDFDEINLTNCYGDYKSPPDKLFSSKEFFIDLSQRVYCDYDVLGLLECLNQFNVDVYEAMNLEMAGCLTGASLSKQNFFKNYYSKAHIPIYHMNSKYDTFCRAGYSGGRCEAFMIGELKTNCYYYDFTSLYPDVGRRRMPYGLPEFITAERTKRWNDAYKNKTKLPLIIGMMRFMIRTKDFNALPIHGIKRHHKLIFPHFGEWTEITLWANEFNYAHSLDIYEYELLEAIHFGDQMCKKKTDGDEFWDEGILSAFFTDGVEKKSLAKKAKKLALALCYKIIINSGYGFWGLNANGDDGEGRDGVEILGKDDVSFWEMLKNGVVNNVGAVGEYTLVRTTKPMPCKDFNVAIASAISSEARIKIHRFMNAIKSVGGNLLYCDTDSCICDVKISDYPEIMKEFCWDGNGEDLGSMKNEAEEKLEKYFVKKYGKAELNVHMTKQKELDGGEFSFDKGIIAGCKQYCLHKKVYDGGFIEAEASKGCKRSLDYSDFHHLLYGSKMEEQNVYEEEIKQRKKEKGIEWEAPEGFRLYERQTQFRSSLIEHIKEGDGCDVKITNIDKSMRINYLKGKVNGIVGTNGVNEVGDVKPLII